MKVKSNLQFNTGITSRHKAKVQGEVKIGGQVPDRINIIAGATHEFEDSLWEQFKEAGDKLVASGALTIIVPPVLSKAAQAAKDTKDEADAVALIAKLKAKKTK